MRIELVCPAAEDSVNVRNLALATLAAMTPADVTLSLRDDTVKRLDAATDLDYTADLAAITVSTRTARRAYELAAAYRQRGVKVVLGGIHPTAMPEEALEHADVVVCGEAEGLWELVVADARAGRLQPIYRHETLPDYRTPVVPDRSIFPKKGYIRFHPVQASRGCPFSCEFCSVTPFFGRKTRLRDPKHVAGEIAAIGRPFVMFSDDNIVGFGEHSRELFRELKPLKIKWFGQASMQGMQDPATLKLMAESGCKGLFVGFESVNRKALVACGKKQNSPDQYLATVQRLRDAGIAVWGAFVFGFDEDTMETFADTAEFGIKASLLMASYSVMTPYPGTPLYWRLKQEGRLLDERWWLKDQRDGFPVFRPKHMTPEQLFEGWQSAWKIFYSGSSILRRAPRVLSTSMVALVGFLPANLFQRRLTRLKILGGNRFFMRDRHDQPENRTAL
jgi:radical SAM superfamily enzyme YgiQ (UPF0313 family)